MVVALPFHELERAAARACRREGKVLAALEDRVR